MDIFSTCRIAFKALGKNKMRAGLTVLGVVIGIAAVTAMVSIGQSASDTVETQFQSLGTNMLIVFPGSKRQAGVRAGWGTIRTLTAQDCEAISANCRHRAGGLADRHGQRPGRLRKLELESQRVGGRRPRLPDRPQLADSPWDLLHAAGNRHGGQGLRRWPDRRGKTFSDHQSAGQTIRIKSTPLEVIGVLEPKGANLLGGSGQYRHRPLHHDPQAGARLQFR